ncbi:MAG: nucleotidyltransferase family protein [Rhodopirellula sp.]|nr:nucleotidyltransferase family protein [Rhodopirellula sp.]
MSTKAPPEAQTYDDWLRRPDVDAVAAMCRFFMRDAPVHQTLRNIATKLDGLGIAYAIAGGMALGAHRFVRATVDVNILVTPEGLAAIHRELGGLGYIAPFAGSKDFKDTSTGVRIEFLIAGQFPGDGKPKPVAFPDPAQAGVEIDGIRYLGLAPLIELKLASGMTGGVARLKDLADVVSLIQALHLSLDFSQQLNPYVRPKYEELCRGLKADV